MSVVRTGPLTVDLAARRVTVNGMPVDIGGFHQTQREWRYLACVAQRVGEFVPYKTLSAEVLDWPDVGRYELNNLRRIRCRLLMRLGDQCKPLIRVSHGSGVTLEHVRPTSDDDLSDGIRHAAETLAWIESRQGPLPDDGYARIETTVGTVRRLAARLEQEAAS